MPAVVCDLDGVVYRGAQPIPGSADALRTLIRNGFAVIFATNNSTRTQQEVAEKLRSVAGLDVAADSIVTSALAGVAVLPDDVRRCLVIGGAGISDAVEASGRSSVATGAEAVIVGLDPEFDYRRLTAAAKAIGDGAIFVATNADPTYPTATGVLPGAGAIVAAIEAATGVEPILAGKPEAPIRSLIRSMGVGEAWVIGDRIETDIRMATNEEDWASILVLTGVAAQGDDTSEADHVVADLASAADLVLSAQDRQ